MNLKTQVTMLCLGLLMSSCSVNKKNKSQNLGDFNVKAQSFADLQVLRYTVPGWEQLTPKQQELCYYLAEAALCGRDMIYDQKSKYGLTVRKTLENIYGSYKGDRNTADWKKFQDYCGRFWFSNGYFHHYANDKFVPECSFEYFRTLVQGSDASGFPTRTGEELTDFTNRMKTVIFDPKFEPKCVNQDQGVDNVAESYNNFYENVTHDEVEDYYSNFDYTGNAPSWGLNSKLLKNEQGIIEERVWKIGGMYSEAITEVVKWLNRAAKVAENPQQKKTIELLAKYYESGDLQDFDDYSIAWVEDSASTVDFINGFIEVYLDAIGKKGSFESVVSIKDFESSKRIDAISKNAQWFEDNSPLFPEHKKKKVVGIQAKVINAVMESGDAAPSTPIGINLPNADWIRKEHGSKSVNLGNIVNAYDQNKSGGGFLEEFEANPEVRKRIKEYGSLSGKLHTDMHECIGHASGQLNAGIATPDITLKTYASTLEEARADLVALYYIYDQKLVDIGVMPNLEVGKAEYDSYIRNGLMTQLVRLKLGDQIEEAHMRNRQLNAAWVYEKGKADNVIEWYKQDGKTYVRINDYSKLKLLFGELLREIQRIKSEGDYQSGKDLVENYGVKVDRTLHQEVLQRYATLNTMPYAGFIQPRLEADLDQSGKATNIRISYPDNFFDQMMRYGKEYSYLPVEN